MVAKSKLTPEQWAQVYATWQADTRPSLARLRQELDLPITNEALRRHARRHNWKKDAMLTGQPTNVQAALKEKPVSAAKADARVEESLHRLATGYTYQEERVLVVNGEIVKTMVLRYCPPSLEAQLIWLQSRQPNRWPSPP